MFGYALYSEIAPDGYFDRKFKFPPTVVKCLAVYSAVKACYNNLVEYLAVPSQIYC